MNEEQTMKLEIFRAIMAHGSAVPEIAAQEANKVYAELTKQEGA